MDPLFALFSTGAWMSASMVLRSKNPVHSVFYLVLVFRHASGLLCLLGHEYFALLQLLVYVGALAVMFLFVVMLLNIPVTEIVAHQRGTFPVAALWVFILAIALRLALLQPGHFSMLQTPLLSMLDASVKTEVVPLVAWNRLAFANTPLVQLAVCLYGMHVDLLILASLILLVAMIGAVALTLKRRVQAPLHDLFAQHNRDFQQVVCLVQKSSIM